MHSHRAAARAIGNVLDFRQDVRRQKHRATGGARFVEELVEHLLHERVETRRRLVEYKQVGIVHEGLDDPDLLPVTFGERVDRPVELEVEQLGEHGRNAQRLDPT